jgi:Arc/MetJ-type ribon-helix-helix transcriptional regulator
MKRLTVRLPDALASEIEGESHRRKVSKSEVVRQRLGWAPQAHSTTVRSLDAIADLIGSVDGLPSDVSARKRTYLSATGYGRSRSS